MDADDRLNAENREKLRKLFAGLRDENVGGDVLECVWRRARSGSDFTVVDHVRIFRNRPDVLWEHRVHEQILPAIRRTGGQVRWGDAAVRHVGYCDPALRQRKLERDLLLLHRELEEMPDHPFTLFNLGSVYQEAGRFAEAVPMLCKSLEQSHPKDSIVRKLYALLAHCHRAARATRIEGAGCLHRRAGSLPRRHGALLFFDAVLREEVGDLTAARIRP